MPPKYVKMIIATPMRIIEATMIVSAFAAGLKRNVNGRQHYRRQQQPNAVSDVSHDDEQRRRQHFYLAAETSIEKLIDGQQLAAKIRRDEQQRNDDATEQVTEDQLQKLKVSATRESDAGNRDESDRRGFGRNDRKGHSPPRHGTIAEKVVARGLLLAAKPGPKQNDPDQVAEDDDEIESFMFWELVVHRWSS